MRGDFWQQVLQGGAQVPESEPLDDLTTELFDMLGNPDPRTREELAYPVLATWISEGVYDDLLPGIGDGATSGLTTGLRGDGDDTVFRRSFSALVLAEVVSRTNAISAVPPATLLTWGDRVTTWLTRERDLRGFVAGKGWAHAVAHGADVLGQLGRSSHFGDAELTVLLDVVGDRVLLPTDYRFHHGEDDRLAYAVMAILHRNLLPSSVLEPWVSRFGESLQAPRQVTEWPNATAFNAQTFLRALHLQLGAGVRGQPTAADEALFANPPEHRADLILAIVDALRAASPWLFAQRS
ncbi:MAG: DUF2785 domain-containing protein [Propionibacteriales bacterium]|nr:DUF2785 domain-containing protein [Propionibacteriales bacterium]